MKLLFHTNGSARHLETKLDCARARGNSSFEWKSRRSTIWITPGHFKNTWRSTLPRIRNSNPTRRLEAYYQTILDDVLFFRFFLKKSYLTCELTTCAGNWLRTITSDRTVYTIIRRFLFELVGTIPLPTDRNYWEVINFILCFAWITHKSIAKFLDKKNSRRS